MSIYDRVMSYCNEEDIPVSKLEKICGIGNGTITKWGKFGVIPSINSLIKISQKTGKPLTYWLGGNE